MGAAVASVGRSGAFRTEEKFQLSVFFMETLTNYCQIASI